MVCPAAFDVQHADTTREEMDVIEDPSPDF